MARSPHLTTVRGSGISRNSDDPKSFGRRESEAIRTYCLCMACLLTVMHQIKRERDAQEAEKELERAALRASELTAQIQADAQRQLLAKQQHTKVRHTAASNTPEAPHSDTPTESFDREIEFGGLKFTTVKIFHPCRGENLVRQLLWIWVQLSQQTTLVSFIWRTLSVTTSMPPCHWNCTL
jgi:hypothetical protein